MTYLDTAASAQKPLSVIHAISDNYEHCYANVHRGVYYLSDKETFLYEDARKTSDVCDHRSYDERCDKPASCKLLLPDGKQDDEHHQDEDDQKPDGYGHGKKIRINISH